MKRVFIILLALISYQIVKAQESLYNTTDGLIDNRINSIFADSFGNVYFNTLYGTSKFDGTKWTTIIIPDSSKTSSNVIPIFKVQDSPKVTDLSLTNIDSRGNSWFTSSNGVVKYDSVHRTNYSTSNSGLISNNVLSIIIDKKNIIWFATDKGVSKFDGLHWTNYTTFNSGLISNIVRIIIIDKFGNKWFGTDAGVSKFDGIHWTKYTSLNSGLPDNNVIGMVTDTLGNLWCGVNVDDGGVITKFDGKTWTTFSTKNGTSTNYIQDIAIDAKNNLWVGIGEDGDLLKFNGKDWTPFKSVYHSRLKPIVVDYFGNVWCGTWFVGVSKFTDK